MIQTVHIDFPTTLVDPVKTYQIIDIRLKEVKVVIVCIFVQ